MVVAMHSAGATERARSVTEGPAPTIRLVRFSIRQTAKTTGAIAGAKTFALPLDDVAEVVALDKAVTTPPRGWIGTLVRDANPIPVADLPFLLGLQPLRYQSGGQRALLLRQGDTEIVRFGVATNDVPTVIQVRRDELQLLPLNAGGAARTFVSATWTRGEEFVLVLDSAAIMAALDQSVSRNTDGLITQLRALPRATAGTAGLATRQDATRRREPLDWPQRALLLSPLETADGATVFTPALPLSCVREVLPARNLHVVPHSPVALAGVFGWRGHSLATIDLGYHLTGIPTTGANRLVVIGPPGRDDEATGVLLIGGNQELRTLDAPQTTRAIPEILSPVPIVAWLVEQEQPIALLDPLALFA